MRFVDSIEPDGDEETVCIQVAAADSLYVTDDFLVTHNTLNDAFIILDEAQNTTPEQMKMFLTRLGFDSKMVVTGDITQVDLPRDQKSGWSVGDILAGVDGIEFVRFGGEDVVRHQLVQRIVAAYDEHASARRPSCARRRAPPAMACGARRGGHRRLDAAGGGQAPGAGAGVGRRGGRPRRGRVRGRRPDRRAQRRAPGGGGRRTCFVPRSMARPAPPRASSATS